jgi:Flp pilus assembly protein TadG
MTFATRYRCRGDGGWAVAEVAIMMPVALVVLGFIVLCGRMGNIQADITSAARDAARAASLQRDLDGARQAAQAVATASLTAHSVTCAQPRTRIDNPSTFAPGGSVTVTVTCDVDLAAVAIPGIPSTATVEKSSSELIDRYRAMQ